VPATIVERMCQTIMVSVTVIVQGDVQDDEQDLQVVLSLLRNKVFVCYLKLFNSIKYLSVYVY
jgi:hypothetical protein